MREKLAVAALIIFLLAHPQPENAYDVSTNRVTTPISIERISELYFMVTGLIMRFERNELRAYTSFMDEALVAEVRHMFGRLYGYATNEARALEWEACASRYLQLYVIRVCAVQAHAYYDYYMHTSDERVRSLRAQCIAQVDAQVLKYFSGVLRYLSDDEVLIYELLRFNSLPVTVHEAKKPPHLIIRLRVDMYLRSLRFVDEPAASSSVFGAQGARIYKNPLPFSPDENFNRELDLFARAQISTLHSYYAASPLVYANAEAFERLNQILDKIFARRMKTQKARRVSQMVRSKTLFLLFTAFIKDEYKRLKCHPMFQNSSFKKLSILIRHKHIKELLERVNTKICEQHEKSLCASLRAMRDVLRRLGAHVGYSLQRTGGIVLILSDTLNDAGGSFLSIATTTKPPTTTKSVLKLNQKVDNDGQLVTV